MLGNTTIIGGELLSDEERRQKIAVERKFAEEFSQTWFAKAAAEAKAKAEADAKAAADAKTQAGKVAAAEKAGRCASGLGPWGRG
jgi:hypothetical protein